MFKALLFINGSPPNYFPDFSNYSIVGCTDGACNYLLTNNYKKLDFILGDLDSIYDYKNLFLKKVLLNSDQDKTDFEKALEYLIKKNINQVDVFGATGLEQDHFLGNLSTAIKFFDTIQITFFDSYGKFFFAKKNQSYKVKKGINVSLIPMKKVKNVTTFGLKYPLQEENLEFGKRIGIRNTTIKEEIKIMFSEGNLLLFIEN